MREISAESPDATLTFAISNGMANLPRTLAKPEREIVAGYVCAGVNCLPEVVRISDLTAILSSQAMN
jgi:hypothetical protein